MAVLPAAPCGALVQWYVEATLADGSIELAPTHAPSVVHESTAVVETLLSSDTFESATGWTGGVAGDTATAGVWVRADPVGTVAQSDVDHSAVGTQCWFTGQGTPGGSAGAADVDNGATTLESPIFATAGSNANMSYWLWYSNNLGAAPGTDSFRVLASLDGGPWELVETVTASATAWMQHVVALPAANTVQLRFVAEDAEPGSLVEAAIDDVSIIAIECANGIAGDLDRDGDVDGADLGGLLAGWGPCAGCAADLDGNGIVDGADLGAMLAAWQLQ
jgi:hypothetical protein